MKKVIGGLVFTLVFISSSVVFSLVNPPTLVFGSQGEEVSSLQQFLKDEGLYSGPVSGFLGAVTESALSEFQKKKELPVTGVVDCATRAQIRVLAPCVGGATSKLSTTDTWYQQNCLPEPVGLEYGRITPMFYTPSSMGGTELVQIGKPFNVSVSGLSSTTLNAKITASDANVSITPASCTNGANTGAMGCTVTVSGEPRDVYLKIHNGRTGIKPVCRSIKVYREPTNYNVSIALDKQAFGSGEAFKVTLSGLPLAKARELGSQIIFTRSNAPASSCESRLDKTICQADGILTCGLLAGTSVPEYLCSATALDTSSSLRYPNKDQDVTYTVYFRTTADGFDTYTFTGGPKTIKLYKQGTQGNGGMTNYGACRSGEGVDPRYPNTGCTRCQNIPNVYRTHISSCTDTGADTFTWRFLRNENAFDRYPSCGTSREGDSCTDPAAHCVTGNRVLSCSNTNPVVTSSSYHGKVVDATTGEPLSGVRVESWSVTGNMFAYASPCPVTTTNTSGEYAFTQAESQSACLSNTGYVRFKKAGYVDDSILVGNEFDKLIVTHRMKREGGAPVDANALLLSPSSATLARTSGSRVVFTLTNGKTALNANNLDVCYEVTKRAVDQYTPTAINKPANPSSCNWVQKWAGNSDWRASGNDLVWTINYGPDWEIPGLEVMLAFRKNNNPSDVTYAVFTVVGGGTQATASASAAGGSGLVIQARPLNQSIDAGIPACKKETLPKLGSSCTTRGPVCVGVNVGQTPAVPVTVVCETLSIEQKSLEVTLAGIVLQAIDNNVFDGQGQAWIRENIPGAAELLDLRQTVIDTVVETVTDVINTIGDTIGDVIDGIGNIIDDIFGGGPECLAGPCSDSEGQPSDRGGESGGGFNGPEDISNYGGGVETGGGESEYGGGVGGGSEYGGKGPYEDDADFSDE